VHSRIEVAWRDAGVFALAQLLDHGEHFLLGPHGPVRGLATRYHFEVVGKAA